MMPASDPERRRKYHRDYYATKTKRMREKYLATGRCGFCGHKRDRFRFLCDGCAEKHRKRQQRVPCPHCAGRGGFAAQPDWVCCHVCSGLGSLARGAPVLAENGY